MAMVSSLASAFHGVGLTGYSPSVDFGLRFENAAPAWAPSEFSGLLIEAAHKKGSGSTKNGRDSQAKRLGVKIFGSEVAKPGSIIIRQRGNKFHAGNNVGVGRDYTLFSLIDGEVKFEYLFPKKQKVSVYPKEPVPENPDSRRVKKRERFRVLREERKVKEEAKREKLIELYNTPAKFQQPVFDMSSLLNSLPAKGSAE